MDNSRPGEQATCGNPIRTVDNNRQPCLRAKWHLGPCNPFSDTAPSIGLDKPSTQVPDSGPDRYLNRLLVGRTAQGQVQFIGRCVSWTDRPTVQVRMLDDTQVSWPAEMCEVVEISPEAMAILLPAKK